MNTTQVPVKLLNQGKNLESFTQNLEQIGGALGETLCALDKHGDANINELLQSHAEKLANLELKGKAYERALAQVSEAYRQADQAKRDKFDFKRQLEAEFKKAFEAHEHRGNIKQTSDEPDVEGADDDGILGVVGGELKNAKCPVTGRSVFELDEPVQCSREFVFEKQAIVAYIKKNKPPHGECPHPQFQQRSRAGAGQNVHITLGELKDCSQRVRRVAEKNRRRQQQTQGTQQAEEIL